MILRILTTVWFDVHLTFRPVWTFSTEWLLEMDLGASITTQKWDVTAYNGKQNIHQNQKKRKCLDHRSKPWLFVFSITKALCSLNLLNKSKRWTNLLVRNTVTKQLAPLPRQCTSKWDINHSLLFAKKNKSQRDYLPYSPDLVPRDF